MKLSYIIKLVTVICQANTDRGKQSSHRDIDINSIRLLQVFLNVNGTADFCV